MVTKSFLNKTSSRSNLSTVYRDSEIRLCPRCGQETIKGMPGGRDAICRNCGYKDPCCSD